VAVGRCVAKFLWFEYIACFEYRQVKGVKREGLIPNMDWATVFQYDRMGFLGGGEGGPRRMGGSTILLLDLCSAWYPDATPIPQSKAAAGSVADLRGSNGVKANEPRELSKDVFGVTASPVEKIRTSKDRKRWQND
jgi:hypothetical protein